MGRRALRFAVGLALAGTLAACGATPTPAEDRAWRAALHQEHPLVGRIWRGDAGAFTDRARLESALAGAAWVLLGEKHDNPDHHQIHAELLATVLAAGPRPVAFEMIEARHRGALATAKTADDVRRAVDWDASGWPGYAMYSPVFDAALAGGGTLIPASPDRAELMALLRGPPEGWPPVDLPDAARARLADHIRVAHCGHANPRMVELMSVGQRTKDRSMADALRAAGDAGVLIAGNGHVRRDYGVPTLLPNAVSVALIEVRAGVERPEDYEIDAFDFVWFTPRVDDKDPCEVFREQLEKMRSRAQ